MMKNKYLIIPIILGVFLFFANGCKKEDEAVKPTITTAQVTDITPTTASSGGNITSDGGATVTASGVVWGMAENPTLVSNTGITTNETKTGTFSSNLTGLTPCTTYYIRAYATNSAGTGYGNQQTFTTPDGILILTTNSVSDITLTTATCGGNITSDGGASVTARGVVWSTAENPTLDSNTGITTDGSGTGSFTSNLTDLTPGTTYYVRAYATNTIGTSYGEYVTFLTDETITDVDGNTYKVIKIGNQIWMTENLKTTHYNDGTAIPLVTDNTAWGNLNTPGYCWYNNDATAYKDTYGALYNWYAVNTGKLAPTGWHVPTIAEWTTLTDYLGGKSVAGGKLKETGTTHWTSPNTGATNETGFTALPGGDRYFSSGNFNDVGNYGFWWSATEPFVANAFYCCMSNSKSSVYSSCYDAALGYSVRCVRD